MLPSLNKANVVFIPVRNSQVPRPFITCAAWLTRAAHNEVIPESTCLAMHYAHQRAIAMCPACNAFHKHIHASWETNYSLGHSALRALRLAASTHGASEAELAAIDRFELYRAERVDVDRLAPLAIVAGLPWADMFPA